MRQKQKAKTWHFLEKKTNCNPDTLDGLFDGQIFNHESESNTAVK